MKRILQGVVLVAVILVTSCKKDDPDPVPYAKFTVNGTSEEYNYATSFNKVCIMSYYCGSFMKDENDESGNIGIGLPSDVASGAVYHTGDSNFSLTYYDEEGNSYNSYYGGTATLEIESWDYSEGSGWVTGTFSGSIRGEEDPVNDSVVFQNGYFKGKIYLIF